LRPCGIFKWSNTSTSEYSLAASLPGLSILNFARGRYKIRRAGGTPLTGLIEVADVSGLGSRRSGSCDSRVRALRCAREWPLCMPSPSMQSTFSLSPLSPLFFSFFIILPPAREKSQVKVCRTQGTRRKIVRLACEDHASRTYPKDATDFRAHSATLVAFARAWFHSTTIVRTPARISTQCACGYRHSSI
jgi:hypothetical protein